MHEVNRGEEMVEDKKNLILVVAVVLVIIVACLIPSIYLREKLPEHVRIIRFDANYVNLWGFGDNIYLGLCVLGFPDSTPILYRMSPDGKLETLLTYGEAKSITENPNLAEIPAVLEAPDGTIFCTTHGAPVHILRKRPSDDVFTSVYRDKTMKTSYGMAVNCYGDIFATMRGPVVVGGPHRSIIRSQDGGDTWATVWSDNNDWLYGIEAVGTYVVAVGLNIIVNSANRGNSWATTAISGAGANVRAVKNLVGTKKFVAISNGTHYYISLNGGAT